MTRKETLIVSAIIFVTSPLSAAVPESSATTAPPGTPTTKYCLRVEAVTGSLVETVQCWTRDDWVEQGVDIDKEWAKEGVNVSG